MEIFNKAKVKEPKIIGRKPKWTQEFMMMVARKVTEGEMSFREAPCSKFSTEKGGFANHATPPIDKVIVFVNREVD